MNHEEAYQEGYARGVAWAEDDLIGGRHRMDAELRRAATVSLETRVLGSAHSWMAAHDLGIARGYRMTLARWDAGELTRSMVG